MGASQQKTFSPKQIVSIICLGLFLLLRKTVKYSSTQPNKQIFTKTPKFQLKNVLKKGTFGLI